MTDGTFITTVPAARVPLVDAAGLMTREWYNFMGALLGRTGGGSATGGNFAPYEFLPVGALYIATTDEDPADSLGFGTWTAIGAGRVLVGLDSGDTAFDALGETGGALTVAAVGTNSAPTFTGSAVAAASTQATPDLVAADVTGTGVSPVTTAAGTVSAPTFTGTPTSVVQPYLVVMIWERTA